MLVLRLVVPLLVLLDFSQGEKQVGIVTWTKSSQKPSGGIATWTKSSQKPSECKDYNTLCPDWASEKECEVNPAYMLTNCRKSCKVCTPKDVTAGGIATWTKSSQKPSECKDYNTLCPNWASEKECEKNPAYMLPNCRKSCKVCTPEDVTAAPFHKKTICEGQSDEIYCGNKGMIHVTSASYGRSDLTTCPDTRIKTTTCHAVTSLKHVKNACEGKSRCTLQASNMLFGDPCIYTYKYLQVTYQCHQENTDQKSSTLVPAFTPTMDSEETFDKMPTTKLPSSKDPVKSDITTLLQKTLCEGQSDNIYCGSNEVIHVTSASYGRNDMTTCPDKRIRTTNCHAVTSFNHVNSICEGRSWCHLHASNNHYGDPCQNTYKYLRVEYQCIAVNAMSGLHFTVKHSIILITVGAAAVLLILAVYKILTFLKFCRSQWRNVKSSKPGGYQALSTDDNEKISAQSRKLFFIQV